MLRTAARMIFNYPIKWYPTYHQAFMPAFILLLSFLWMDARKEQENFPFFFPSSKLKWIQIEFIIICNHKNDGFAFLQLSNGALLTWYVSFVEHWILNIKGHGHNNKDKSIVSIWSRVGKRNIFSEMFVSLDHGFYCLDNFQVLKNFIAHRQIYYVIGWLLWISMARNFTSEMLILIVILLFCWREQKVTKTGKSNNPNIDTYYIKSFAW